MSRTITVRVTDRDGYGKGGYRITTYSGDSASTDPTGVCKITVSGDDEIYCEGSKIAGGQEAWFDKTVIHEVY